MTAAGDPVSEALRECAREPIHIPGSIQPHGFLIALDAKGRVAQASANAAAALGVSPGAVLGSDFAELTGKAAGELLRGIDNRAVEAGPEYLHSLVAADGHVYEVVAHCRSGIRVIEFERARDTGERPASLFTLIREFMSRLAPAMAVGEMDRIAASEIRRLTGFDRVLIYRFDSDWNGNVIAEDRNEELPSYLGLRFPASDIPAQARELYRLNRLRIIPDADYIPVPTEPAIHPETGKPLDLSWSVLRSVSPVHVQYMKNMGTGASLSVSILRDGVLWGLVSCHNRVARQVSFEARSACDMIAQVLSAQRAAAEHRAEAERRVSLKSTQTALLGWMAGKEDFTEALLEHPDELLACTGAAGAAVIFGGKIRMLGTTPAEAEIRALAAWLPNHIARGSVFSTASLASLYEPAREFQSTGSGLLAAPISSLHDSFILWFRPEQLQTVEWAGDPRKAKEPDASGRLNPRHSFEIWKQQVEGASVPWAPSEIDSATELRQAIVGIVLKKAEELAALTGQLQRSNQELEAFSYSVSHDLRAPFRHIVGYAELLREREAAHLSETGQRYIGTIIESAQYAGTLVDNLLSFSQIGRVSLHPAAIDTRRLVDEVVREVLSDEPVAEPPRQIEWKIGPLPRAYADLFMLRLVFRNLLSNALKYSRTRQPARIEISASATAKEAIFTVRDNGVGFDPRYSDKLFGIFQRLHKMEEFEGTGIGLANVRRIVMRHGGRTWAEGAVDAGAAFSFSLPLSPENTPGEKS
jgi:light-regulated signal transduction histidine kinase (bacteriophytochrome)